MIAKIKDIPFPDIRERAIKNFREARPECLFSDEEILSYRIQVAFMWNRTEEGDIFWSTMSRLGYPDDEIPIRKYHLKLFFTNKQSTNASTSKQP